MKKNKGAIFVKLGLPLLFVVIVAYLIISAFYGLQSPYTLVTVYEDALEDSLLTDGWVIRTEIPISGGVGAVQLTREDGEKVGAGQVIAVVDRDAAYEENQQEILHAKSDLGALQFATYAGSPTGAKLEDATEAAMMDLRASASRGDFSELYSQSENYRKLTLRREYLLSGQSRTEMDQSAWMVSEAYTSLQNAQSGGAAITVTTPASGTFSSHLDGYEYHLAPSRLKGLSTETLASFDQLIPDALTGMVGKVILSTSWYYAVKVPEDAANDFVVGAPASVFFDSLLRTMDMEIYSVSEPQEGYAIVTFTSKLDLEAASTLRRESGRVVFHRSEGILVPRQAVRVLEDGSLCVYVVNGYTAALRPVKIVDEDENSYLVKAAPESGEDKRVLRSGDQVILASAELFDGKVVR